MTNEINLKVGKLGRFIFPVRFYAYTGSAKKNTNNRIKWHLSKKKSLHWHIDYLFNNGAVNIIDKKKQK